MCQCEIKAVLGGGREDSDYTLQLLIRRDEWISASWEARRRDGRLWPSGE